MNELWRDIRDQSEALVRHTSGIEASAQLVERVCPNGMPPVFTGMASSLYAWEPAALLLARSGPVAPWVVDAAQLVDYGPPPGDDARPLFLLSRSGASPEIVRLLERTPARRLTIGITEVLGSPLARHAQHVLHFDADEKALTNTKSFTLSLAYALACAYGLGLPAEVSVREWVGEAAAAVGEVIDGSLRGADEIAELLSRSAAAMLLGRGYLTGIAQETALDLQETARLPVLAVTGGLFRHGSIELTARPDIATLVLIPNDVGGSLALGVVDELVGRRAPVAAVATCGVRVPEGCPTVCVPDVRHELLPIVYAVALQCITAALLERDDLAAGPPSFVAKVTVRE